MESWHGTVPLGGVVMDGIEAAGLVFAGGLDEDLGKAFSADATSGP